jgi:hypothetical protein
MLPLHKPWFAKPERRKSDLPRPRQVVLMPTFDLSDAEIEAIVNRIG